VLVTRGNMEFDKLTIVLLCANPDGPKLDEATENEIQDAHMDHLASMHEAGEVLAAGPVLGVSTRQIRGLCIHAVDPDRARELHETDPAVRSGRLTVQAFTWMVPTGAVSFSRTRFPHSQAEL
jgi:uncharacterized protein